MQPFKTKSGTEMMSKSIIKRIQIPRQSLEQALPNQDNPVPDLAARKTNPEG
jgi:hypothetical protein